MPISSGLRGHGTEVDAGKLQIELEPALVNGETIERAFKLIRDQFVFTSKRFLIIDRQGVTGRKVEYHSIPYKSIRHFSVETPGRFDRDAELKIWVAGFPRPIEKELKKGVDIIGVQKMLASHVLD